MQVPSDCFLDARFKTTVIKLIRSQRNLWEGPYLWDRGIKFGRRPAFNLLDDWVARCADGCRCSCEGSASMCLPDDDPCNKIFTDLVDEPWLRLRDLGSTLLIPNKCPNLPNTKLHEHKTVVCKGIPMCAFWSAGSWSCAFVVVPTTVKSWAAIETCKKNSSEIKWRELKHFFQK